jgi:hypothetical protein
MSIDNQPVDLDHHERTSNGEYGMSKELEEEWDTWI